MDFAFLTAKLDREENAKVVELAQWKSMGVYEEVDNTGQDHISLRWVLKDKIDGEGKTVCKARLCVRERVRGRTKFPNRFTYMLQRGNPNIPRHDIST